MSGYDFSGATFRPDPNCRSCTDFKSWSKQSNKYFTQKVGSFNFEFSRSVALFSGQIRRQAEERLSA